MPGVTANPFDTAEMAAGYARFRPPVHARVLALALGGRRCDRALDLGCGAGFSLRALRDFADVRVGFDPSEAMTRLAAGSGDLAVARGEELPFWAGSFALVTAAGSLNYSDIPVVIREVGRVLRPAGLLVVYDFGAGRSFRASGALDEWFEVFRSRYPSPAGEARELSPEILAGEVVGFEDFRSDRFEIGISLTRDFYLEYMLTETNVAAAVRKGIDPGEIRAWCADTLRDAWGISPEREVLFRGYYFTAVKAADCVLTVGDRAITA